MERGGKQIPPQEKMPLSRIDFMVEDFCFKDLDSKKLVGCFVNNI